MLYHYIVIIKKLIIVLATTLMSLSSFAKDVKTENLDLFVGDWIVNCTPDSTENKKKCALERSLFIDQKRKKKLVSIIMQTKTSSEDVRFILISPLGTLLQSGVKIGFDDKLVSENAYGFNTCKPFGCVTSMMVKKETLNRFKKSDNLNLDRKSVV